MSRRAVLVATSLAALLAAAVPGHAQTQTCDAAQFRVVVDVGHTPEIPGAISARGATEYDFNLRLARVIERRLNDAGFARTSLLLARGPAIPSLVQRVSRANAMTADLLLSVHHDSVPQSFKQRWDFDGRQLEYSDRFKGHSLFVSTQNADYAGSLAFARLLGARLKLRGLQYTPHYTEGFMGARRRQLVDAETGVYRYDQLLILKTTHMPAVLLEAGSIIHRDEEMVMASEAQQSLIADAVTEAVDRFCASKAAKTQRASRQR
jgi:N-acetylmuramoyl-L-alanine amidase